MAAENVHCHFLHVVCSRHGVISHFTKQRYLTCISIALSDNYQYCCLLFINKRNSLRRECFEWISMARSAH